MKKKIDEILTKKDSLFHYTSTEKAIQHIIFEKQLKLNPLFKMSDPYENKNFDFDYKNMNVERSPEIIQKERGIQNAIKKHCKIVSFCSEIGLVKRGIHSVGYKHPRMWDQYADSHKGVCIVFSKHKLYQALQQKYPSNLIFKNYVNYISKHLHIQREIKLYCDKLLDSTQESFVNNFLNEKQKTIFFTKNIDYITEDEFRFVIYDKTDEKCRYLDISNCVIGIITGEKCRHDLGVDISDLCKKLGIFCGAIEWRNGEPDVW